MFLNIFIASFCFKFAYAVCGTKGHPTCMSEVNGVLDFVDDSQFCQSSHKQCVWTSSSFDFLKDQGFIPQVIGTNALGPLAANVKALIIGDGFRSNDLLEIEAGAFDSLTHLTHLVIQNTKLTTIPSGLFSQLTNLRTLSLVKNPNLSELPKGIFDVFVDNDSNSFGKFTLNLNENNFSPCARTVVFEAFKFAKRDFQSVITDFDRSFKQSEDTNCFDYSRCVNVDPNCKSVTPEGPNSCFDDYTNKCSVCHPGFEVNNGICVPKQTYYCQSLYCEEVFYSADMVTEGKHWCYINDFDGRAPYETEGSCDGESKWTYLEDAPEVLPAPTAVADLYILPEGKLCSQYSGCSILSKDDCSRALEGPSPIGVQGKFTEADYERPSSCQLYERKVDYNPAVETEDGKGPNTITLSGVAPICKCPEETTKADETKSEAMVEGKQVLGGEEPSGEEPVVEEQQAAAGKIVLKGR